MCGIRPVSVCIGNGSHFLGQQGKLSYIGILLGWWSPSGRALLMYALIHESIESSQVGLDCHWDWVPYYYFAAVRRLLVMQSALHRMLILLKQLVPFTTIYLVGQVAQPAS